MFNIHDAEPARHPPVDRGLVLSPSGILRSVGNYGSLGPKFKSGGCSSVETRLAQASNVE